MSDDDLMDSESVSILSAWQWFNNQLGCPKYVCAPMVQQSELAFRMLTRKHGVHLCFTPMIPARIIIDGDAGTLERLLQTRKDDRPLIVQLCGTEAETLLRASILITQKIEVDGIDINLGCPKQCAQHEGYGYYFAQNNPQEVFKTIQTLSQNLPVPVTCKIRLFESLDQTIQFAKNLEKSGCWMLTVHGRRVLESDLTDSDWNAISEIKKSLNIPVLGNGGIKSKKQADQYILQYGVDGVMVANGLLSNPYMFNTKVNNFFDSLLSHNLEINTAQNYLDQINNFFDSLWSRDLDKNTSQNYPDQLNQGKFLWRYNSFEDNLKMNISEDYQYAHNSNMSNDIVKNQDCNNILVGSNTAHYNKSKLEYLKIQTYLQQRKNQLNFDYRNKNESGQDVQIFISKNDTAVDNGDHSCDNNIVIDNKEFQSNSLQKQQKIQQQQQQQSYLDGVSNIIINQDSNFQLIGSSNDSKFAKFNNISGQKSSISSTQCVNSDVVQKDGSDDHNIIINPHQVLQTVNFCQCNNSSNNNDDSVILSVDYVFCMVIEYLYFVQLYPVLEARIIRKHFRNFFRNFLKNKHMDLWGFLDNQHLQSLWQFWKFACLVCWRVKGQKENISLKEIKMGKNICTLDLKSNNKFECQIIS